jgi:hypothetical protein
MLLPIGLGPDLREGVNPSADCGLHLYFRSLEFITPSSVTSICDHLLGDLYPHSRPVLCTGLDFATSLVTSICDPFLGCLQYIGYSNRKNSIDWDVGKSRTERLSDPRLYVSTPARSGDHSSPHALHARIPTIPFHHFSKTVCDSRLLYYYTCLSRIFLGYCNYRILLTDVCNS